VLHVLRMVALRHLREGKSGVQEPGKHIRHFQLVYGRAVREAA
jgi:hypothetical protein